MDQKQHLKMLYDWLFDCPIGNDNNHARYSVLSRDFLSCIATFAFWPLPTLSKIFILDKFLIVFLIKFGSMPS